MAGAKWGANNQATTVPSHFVLTNQEWNRKAQNKPLSTVMRNLGCNVNYVWPTL